MAIEEVAITIGIVAVLGFGLAYLVGRLANRDKARREQAGEALPPAGVAPPGEPAVPAPQPAEGRCPTCKTAYRADLAFCWACGRDKTK